MHMIHLPYFPYLQNIGANMSTLPISQVHSSYCTHYAPKIRNKLYNISSSSIVKISSYDHKRLPEGEQVASGLKRREVIGISICFRLFDVIYQQVALAVEAVAPQCELVVTPSGLAYCDKVVGTGPEAAKGQLIKAHYVGKLENGTVFDSSYNRGKPLTFHIGVGEVIKGWDQGILGGDGVPPMLAGGKRRLLLPSELAYGMRGAGCRGGSCIIPPNSVLLFDVDFIGKA